MIEYFCALFHQHYIFTITIMNLYVILRSTSRLSYLLVINH